VVSRDPTVIKENVQLPASATQPIFESELPLKYTGGTKFEIPREFPHLLRGPDDPSLTQNTVIGLRAFLKRTGAVAENPTWPTVSQTGRKARGKERCWNAACLP
jgi:hypothetical protein